jgi:uncharacterized protein YbjT (DUF2867 family)
MELVVGATGLLGTEICRRLRERGEEVRALVRSTSEQPKVDKLAEMGCEIVRGDLQDRRSLEAACEGVWTVITTASTTGSRQAHDSLEKTDLEGQLNLIDAAEKKDVKRFVLISVSGNFEADTNLHRAKRRVEEKVRESGIAYTILRPSCFMEIWLSPFLGLDVANRKAKIFGAGDQPVSYVSYVDVAEFAVRAAVEDSMANQTIELGGPDAISQLEVVKLFERELGAPFEVTHVPEDALRHQLNTATGEYDKTFAALMLGVSDGDPIEMSDTLKRVPVKLRSVRDYARQFR